MAGEMIAGIGRQVTKEALVAKTRAITERLQKETMIKVTTTMLAPTEATTVTMLQNNTKILADRQFLTRSSETAGGRVIKTTGRRTRGDSVMTTIDRGETARSDEVEVARGRGGQARLTRGGEALKVDPREVMAAMTEGATTRHRALHTP